MPRPVATIQADIEALRAARASGVKSSEVSGEEGSYRVTYASGEEMDSAIARLETELARATTPNALPGARTTRGVYSR